MLNNLINIITLSMLEILFKFNSKEIMNTNNHTDEEGVIFELENSNNMTLNTRIRIVFTTLQISVPATKMSFLINLYEIIIILHYNI